MLRSYAVARARQSRGAILQETQNGIGLRKAASTGPSKVLAIVPQIESPLANGRIHPKTSHQNSTGVPAHAEFYYYKEDNLIRVDNGPDGVVVRAMRDNFSEEDKSCFVQQLALEGFIPESFQRFPGGSFYDADEVTWLVDDSWTLRVYPLRLVSRFGRPFIATAGMLLLLAATAFFGFRVIESTAASFHPLRQPADATHVSKGAGTKTPAGPLVL